ncbi:open rectifier potassium channel protein 1 [Macrosteles quadrilineatus]|uniref:open rectifier potassium channel protein 1 n=1 Tax=Macrosteles quadrilineatus TaxID=74068 RepID=UPI0023E1F80D|nr:open rectifier potassium channel protein 1 [Macrosteles quadrilineatus]XP_054263748.1 open rectifier potassium channel protein 1 [Macrosteles quadrilineatus]XP_054263750.1 open rectifier potassium channel protein 1 [Macrosteles quadrilineatus]XP_054263751.1 open rectifier potassium channel protein 1 [Macrosteles quadrilineatus]
MSFKQYMVLFFMFMMYLFVGAFIFYSVERPVEEDRRALAKAEALEIRALLRRHYAKGLPEAHMELLERLSEYCGKPFFIDGIHIGEGNDTDPASSPPPSADEPFDNKPFLWTFYNSFLFVLCTLSTIGYGNLAPTTRQGRILDVMYGLIGIPFNGIVLAQMAEYFGSLFMRAHHRYKSHEYQTRLSLFADILTYLILGTIVFIFFPAAIFVYFEDWTFDTGVYYAFVTLATIGYGDLVAGQSDTDTWIYNVYKVMVLVWIMFGLGYMLMIVGFITRAMRSKKVRKIEHKLATTIKQTQNRIWNEFSQDVTYLRRMLNEMYLLKIQPVYVEKETEEDREGVRRIKSCPNLNEWPILVKREDLEDSSSEEDLTEEEMAANFKRIAMRRRRGHAENVMTPQVRKRRCSDTDLSRIDRKATFGDDSGTVEPKLLLAKVVDALGTSVGSKFSLESLQPPSRKISQKLNGIHGFSDEEILASERGPNYWSITGHKMAASEQPTPIKRNSLLADETRTWTGVNPVDIQRFIKIRTNDELRRSNQNLTRSDSISSVSSEPNTKVPPSRMRRMSMAVTNLFSQAIGKSQEAKETRDGRKKRRTGNTPGMLPVINNNKRLSLPHEDQTKSMLHQVNYLTQVNGRRGSVFAALASEMTPKASQNPLIPVSPVLEQTSVADFLRLLSSLQAKLDPSMTPEVSDASNLQSLNRKSINPNKELVLNSLAALFNHNTSAQQNQTVSGPVNLSHPSKTAARASSFLEAKGKQGRRFSLIPPMDVDHPSGQKNPRDIFRLKKRSVSSQNMFQNSDGSTINIPVTAPQRQRPQRTSLSGTAKYINSKIQSSSEGIKSALPNIGYRKFSVRPVSAQDMPLGSDTKTNPKQMLPTITVENYDKESSNVEEGEEELKDIVISKL